MLNGMSMINDGLHAKNKPTRTLHGCAMGRVQKARQRHG